MPAEAPLRHLPWDSDFFGPKIGRLIPTRIDDTGMRDALEWCEREGIDCLYFLADPADETTVRLAQHNGFGLMDERVTLETLSRRCDTPRIRDYRSEDGAALREIVRGAHTDSRFFADPRFARDKCAELYDRWFLRDASRPDGAMLVADLDGVAIGYISVVREGDHSEIGVLGVGEAARGRGLGLELVEAALDWSAARGIARVTVVTQGRNAQAQRLYGRAGFVTRSTELWYHRWFDRPRDGGEQ